MRVEQQHIKILGHNKSSNKRKVHIVTDLSQEIKETEEMA